MVQPRFRSNSARKRMFKTSGGRVSVIYKAKKASKARCAICGRKLHGVPNLSRAGMRKLSKTEKRPERIFGGVLCGNCVRDIIKEKIRLQGGVLQREDVDVLHLKYIDMLKK